MFRFTVRRCVSFTSGQKKNTFHLEPIKTHADLDKGLRLAAQIFAREEALSVVCGVTEEVLFNYSQDLHKSFDESASKGVYLSHLALDSTGRVGASFLVFPANVKRFPELPPIGALTEHLYELANMTDFDTKLLPPSYASIDVSNWSSLANKDPSTTVWFGCAAVAEFARGQGLQKLAKSKVIESARKCGFKSMVTECTSTASAKSMMANSGLGTQAFSRVSLPYKLYNNGEFARCCDEFNCDAIVLVEEVF